MDGIYLAQHLLKIIKERRDRITEMLESGSVKNMEEYSRLVGSLESMDYISSELKQILDKHEEHGE
jgi:hypothetical protein|tara:strand:- start:271 stop:468 length:198 start_codon:yes stop_codon:yes gene_type:complete